MCSNRYFGLTGVLIYITEFSKLECCFNAAVEKEKLR